MKRTAPNPKRTAGLIIVAVAVMVSVAACSSDSNPDEIVLLTHDSFAVSDGVLEEFTAQTGITVVQRTGGDAGTMLNQAVLTKDNPIADVIYGVDNTFISRAIDNDLFVSHRASGIENVSELLLVDGDLATPIDYGDVCVNYHMEGLENRDVPIPANLDDLLDPTYRDLFVVEDPATSSPGLAFLMATIAAYPDGADYDWKAYWTDLFANGVSVASDWSEAYYTQFSQAGGDRPLVVSYASSPPAEVLFGELTEAPTGVMTEGCFRQIEYAGILKGSEHEANAGVLIDFLLSPTFQNDIPLNMFVYPANSQATLPQVFADYTVFPDAPVVMEPHTIDENRERWIEEWTQIARS
ncbi:MAG: thiamine ABC transporter substrate-binding protein [Armatimonadetes bacterium]|nr:MAG: thiamine ABC transporter substrate-binding protein [Armatimonadota bacterium]